MQHLRSAALSPFLLLVLVLVLFACAMAAEGAFILVQKWSEAARRRTVAAGHPGVPRNVQSGRSDRPLSACRAHQSGR